MAVRDYVPLNFELMSHPLNWLIIGLMVMFASLAISLVFPAGHTADSTAA